MKSNRKRLFALFPLATLALSACSDSIGPVGNVEPLDAVTANQEAQSVTQTLEQHPALPSLELLEVTAPIWGGSGAALLLQATSPFSPGADGQGLRLRMERMQAAAGPYLSSANPAVIIPADLLGKCLGYNPQTGEYEVVGCADNAPAPANGVRVYLYARDPVFERPTGDPVGHADFMDVSTPSEDALQIQVYLYSLDPTTPIIDYTASASVEVVGGVTVVFRAFGYIDDAQGGRRLDFDLEQRISEQELQLNYKLTANDNGVTIAFTAYAGPNRDIDGITFTLSVWRGEDPNTGPKLTLNVSEAGISGTLDLPGTENDITILVNGEEWVILHEDGTEITEDEAQAIRNMFRLLDRIEHVVHKLLRPAHRVLRVPVLLLR